MPENRVTMQQKKAVAERAKEYCEYCRSPVGNPVYNKTAKENFLPSVAISSPISPDMISGKSYFALLFLFFYSINL
ncbi:MAG: hypothetical protein V7K92_10440 [Nostoc sp.]|uniref:hypothetical protein n=1 Tax=Nostoc sp. TaxID=1180 RepID=UPI002FF1CC62